MPFTSDKTRQGAAGVSTGYDIDYSCRFGDGDTYLHKTDFGVGNRKTWTFSAWVKRSRIGYMQYLMGSTYGVGEGYIRFNLDDTIEVLIDSIGSTQTTAKYKDPSAWYHVVVKCDATNTDLYVYVNGVVVASNTSVSNADGIFNYDINHGIGHDARSGGDNLDGYLAEVHFIDGTALTPTSFGEAGDYGEWKPIKVSGVTYGTNGFYLDFSDSANLGDDAEGSFDWDETDGDNIVAHDQMLDTPTKNFPTLNAIDAGGSITLSEGNLEATNGTTWKGVRGTLAPSTGKWYYEAHLDTATTYAHVGVMDVSTRNNDTKVQDDPNSWWYRSDGSTSYNSGTSENASLTANSDDDIVQVAYDLDAGKIWFGVNNSWILSGNPAAGSNEVYSGLSGTLAPALGLYGSTVCANFGQDSSFAGNRTAQGNGDYDFYYAPPSGFKALCTKDLPAVAVIPSEHFNALLYTGNGSTGRAMTGVGFQPDFLWVKSRSGAYNHRVTDALLGATNSLIPNNDEDVVDENVFDSLDSDGFTLGDDNDSNANTATYVAWNWKGGNATLGTGDFTQGTIASTCSRNVAAGFSIVNYTGTGSAGTVGHGLSSTPAFIIVKNTTKAAGESWQVYHHKTASDPETDGLLLNTNAAVSDSDARWNDTAPTATLFSVKDDDSTNDASETMRAYCFHEVEGFSKFGKYTGGGYPFIYTGFRPAWLVIKRTDSTSAWTMLDNIRGNNTYNPVEEYFAAQASDAEATHRHLDFVSNGFKLDGTGGDFNGSGNDYIYMAFAETPFKHANAR